MRPIFVEIRCCDKYIEETEPEVVLAVNIDTSRDKMLKCHNSEITDNQET